jgi:outer membrane protein assembly factor BamE (lipoprotein component of BamABCDE complex)
MVGFILSCGPEYHAKKVQAGLQGDRLTVGTVQREIRKGMTGAEVIETLGSPNVITSEDGGREVWVYDKFATDVVASGSQGGVWLILGVVGGSAGAASSSQRTLTVVVKFDEQKKVRDFAYHASRF